MAKTNFEKKQYAKKNTAHTKSNMSWFYQEASDDGLDIRQTHNPLLMAYIFLLVQTLNNTGACDANENLNV